MKGKYILGLDIGGTKIECALFVTRSNNVIEKVASERIKTLRDQGYENVMSRITKLILDVLKQTKISLEEIIGLGAGLPGSINPSSRRMINGNSQIFIDKDFIGDLSKLTKIQNIKVANDANLFTLAETLQGAGQLYIKESGIDNSELVGVGIILGTGCGGGFCINGKLFDGAHGGAAEIGHSVLINKGRACYCGRMGCAEQYLSGSSVEKIFKELKPSTVKELKTSEIFQINKSSIISNEQLKNLSNKLLLEYREYLLEFLTNLTAFYDPHFFVLGGGVSTIDEIYEGVEEKLWKRLFVKGSKPRLFRHQISDSAGALGAALLIHQTI